jgi:hypothetical protein
MKKLSIIIFLIALVGLFSCKKDETKATVSASPVLPVLKLTAGDTVVLQKPLADTMITFQWTPVNFGVQLVVTYNLQMDKVGDNFDKAVSLGTTTNLTSLSISTGDLDNKLLSLEFNPDIQPPTILNVEFRVQASYSSSSTPVNSTSVKKVYQPYYIKVVYPLIFVPGNYQGWNPADSLTVIYSALGNNIYDGYVWMGSVAPAYKYTVGPSWTTNYGDNAPPNGGLLLNSSNNIVPTTGEGYYHLHADLVALTHTYLLTTWSLYGASTGNTDVAMAYDSVARTWSATTNLTAGLVYFRANNSNTLAYSDPTASGSLSPGTSGITVSAAGNYTVTLNLSGAIFRYSLIMKKK